MMNKPTSNNKGNQIGAEQMRVMSEVLKKNSSLTWLSLAGTESESWLV